ncbi:MAG: glutamate-5-semialdehyde dehydrogenase, partial [Oscillospiraceae bacterium]|nr:glutamate-5-semialdehyde dehydrogenase [Oscillospiraceae bacterium]
MDNQLLIAMNEMGAAAKAAAAALRVATTDDKNAALEAMADALLDAKTIILAANAIDVENGWASGLSEALIDRLTLSDARIEGMARGIRKVAALPDPCGEIIEGGVRTDGLFIRKVRVPLGVVGIIYESRPNVTSDAASLCLKSGNACILRGGKEAINSNKAIVQALRSAAAKSGLPADSVQLVKDASRESAAAMMKLQALDVLVPRGGASLIRSVVENATVPVIETGVGNCHCFVDASADIQMAADIIYNGKTSRPSVCNALESLLIHKDAAAEALPVICARLAQKNVEIRGDEATRDIIPGALPATDEDYAAEFLDYVISCRVVNSLDEAIAHIEKYSSGHSECIVTQDVASAARFVGAVDSAAVYVNASTRYTDGEVFGLGAEIG